MIGTTREGRKIALAAMVRPPSAKTPAVWVKVFGYAEPIFPYDAPGMFSMFAAFFGCWLFSKLDHSQQQADEALLFEAQLVRSQTGIGASTAASH